MGSLFLFPDRAVFTGPLRDNELHTHHALQLVSSPDSFRLALNDGRALQARMVLINSDVPHALEGDSENQIVVLIDRESQLAGALQARLGSESVVARDHPFSDNASGMLDCAVVLAGSDHLARAFLDEAGTDPTKTDPEPRIARAIAFIAASEDFRASLGSVARHVGLSEGRLGHLFKEQIGVPIRRFIMWLRIRRAIALRAGGASLAESAHAAGFADQAHFSRTFKEMFGVKPGQVLSGRAEVKLHVCPEILGR